MHRRPNGQLEKEDAVLTCAGGPSDTPFKRKHERNPSFLAADLVLSERYAPVSCLVIDTSEDGFRLHIETPHKLPPHVTLVLSHPRRAYACEVIWRVENEVGLKVDIQHSQLHPMPV